VLFLGLQYYDLSLDLSVQTMHPGRLVPVSQLLGGEVLTGCFLFSIFGFSVFGVRLN